MADQHARVSRRAVLDPPPARLAFGVGPEMTAVQVWALRLALLEQRAALVDLPESRVALAAARAELAVARAQEAASEARCEAARFSSRGGGR